MQQQPPIPSQPSSDPQSPSEGPDRTQVRPGIDPNTVMPPEQPRGLFEDTALPVNDLMDAFDKAFAWQQGQQQLQDEQAEQQQQAAELSPEVSEKVADASSIQSAESAAGASLSSVNKLMPDSPPSSHQLAVKRPPTGTAATLIFDSECDTSEQQLPQGASQQGNAVSASRPGAQNAHAAQLEQHAAQPGCSQHDQLSTHGHTGQTVPVEQQAANSGAACVEEPGLRSTTGCSGSTQCAWCGRSAVD